MRAMNDASTRTRAYVEVHSREDTLPVVFLPPVSVWRLVPAARCLRPARADHAAAGMQVCFWLPFGRLLRRID
jgi:hypothetical protein